MSGAVGTLARVTVRRQWKAFVIWTLALVFTAAYCVILFEDVVGDGLQAIAPLLHSPAAIVFTGPGYGTDDLTVGALMAWELLSWFALAQAIMSVMFVVRASRTDEENGLGEFVAAGAISHRAPTAAAVLSAVVANLAVGVLTAVGLWAVGLDLVGSIAFAAGSTMVGLFFTGVAGLAVAIMPSARSALMASATLVGLAFFLRGIGDIQKPLGGWLSWISPIGWAQQARVYVDERWWPILMGLGISVVLIAAAIVLASKRDLGTGLLDIQAPANEKARGPRGMWALAARQTGVVFPVWIYATIAMAGIYAALAGAVQGSFADLLSSNPTLEAYFGAGQDGVTVDSFLALVVRYTGMVVAAFAVVTSMRLARDEQKGLAEMYSASAAPRWTWIASLWLVAVVGSAVLLLIGAGTAILASGISLHGDYSAAGDLLAGMMSHLPGCAALAGLTVLLVAIHPRMTGVIWLVYVAMMFIEIFGVVMGFPDWVLNLSVFHHAFQLPGGTVDGSNWAAIGILAAVGVVLAAVAAVVVEKRDLHQA